jgi:hypothetical protein
MEATTVTTLWMAGVMAVMALYGLVAVVGLLKGSDKDQ